MFTRQFTMNPVTKLQFVTQYPLSDKQVERIKDFDGVCDAFADGALLTVVTLSESDSDYEAFSQFLRELLSRNDLR